MNKTNKTDRTDGTIAENSFTIEETLLKNCMPYFPLSKMAKLINFKYEHLIDALFVNEKKWDIISFSEQSKSCMVEVYSEPAGCLLLIYHIGRNKLEQNLFDSLEIILNYILNDRQDSARAYIESPAAHPFCKAFFDWSFEIGVEFWKDLPESEINISD